MANSKMRLIFRVRGSSGDEYLAEFSVIDGDVVSSCTCMAGSRQQFCKHRMSLLDGDISGLIDDNFDDIRQLKAMIAGTDFEQAYREDSKNFRAALSNNSAKFKSLTSANTDKPRRRMRALILNDIPNTGIKAGMMGEVIVFQPAGTRGADYFTTMVGDVYLVRFTKRSLKDWNARIMFIQPVANHHLPVGAELWIMASELELLPPLDDTSGIVRPG